MKKNLYLAIMVTALTISLVACGKEVETPVVEETVETPVVEETPVAAETPKAVEEVKETEETEEAPKVVDVSADTTEFVPYTAEDIAEWKETDINFLKGVYTLLAEHDASLEKTDDILVMLNTGVLEDVSTEELLKLVNEDHSKAFDIIEKCGVDFTTDEGEKLVASELRMEIKDYDTFFEVRSRVLGYSSELIKYAAEKKRETDKAIEAKDATKAQELYDITWSCKAYADELKEITDIYTELINYLK